MKEIDKAIIDLDKDRLIEISKKANIPMPEDEISFWGGVHKARLYIPSATKEQKEESRKWLMKNGFIPAIYIEN